MTTDPDRSSVPARTAMVVLAATVCAGVTAVLLWVAGYHPAEDVLAAAAAWAAAFKFTDSLIS